MKFTGTQYYQANVALSQNLVLNLTIVGKPLFVAEGTMSELRLWPQTEQGGEEEEEGM